MAELIQYANGVPGIKWPLDKAVVRIGRSDNLNDIAIDDAYASKSHAQIEIVLNQDQSQLEYYLRDLGSTNHTFHNQAPIEHTRLNHNDIVMIGKSKFVFLVQGTQEYVSVDDVANFSSAEAAKDVEDSLSNAVEEITREFKPLQDEEDLDTTVFASKSGRHKFSRRLNIY
jgi:pSer/pThr/pTyr-binding forkhead associated (FHA) protein